MEETTIQEWAQELMTVHLPRWEELPELELYMDQVITLVGRYVSPLISEGNHHLLSSAMVNNYVKHKLVPPPIKKRYNRNHLAYLISITLLKQVFAIPDINALIELQLKNTEPQVAYNNFCLVQEEKIQEIAQTILGEKVVLERVDVPGYHLAMESAVASFTQKMLTEQLIQIGKKAGE